MIKNTFWERPRLIIYRGRQDKFPPHKFSILLSNEDSKTCMNGMGDSVCVHGLPARWGVCFCLGVCLFVDVLVCLFVFCLLVGLFVCFYFPVSCLFVRLFVCF